MRLPLLLALAIALTHPLGAQAHPVRPRTVSFEWLGDRIDRRDDIISPGRFGGMVWGTRAGYGGDWRTHRTSITAEFRTGSLSGSIANGSTETVYDARLAGAYLRPTRVALVGAELAIRGSAYSHSYGGSGFSEDYGLLLMSLSPAVGWDRGVWRVRASVPVLSLVSRPYSRLNITRGRLPVHVASLNKLRALTVHVAYTAASSRRAALRASYGLEVLSIARDQGLAAVDNRFSVGVLWRLGQPR